jgi:hypothetical protein
MESNMTDSNEVVMIRYGKVNNQTKNCLFTIRKGETIYFGISRCNKKHYNFLKAKGKLIASERATIAAEVYEQEVSDFEVHESGLRGVCPKSQVVEMLQYLDNIDENMLAALNG